MTAEWRGEVPALDLLNRLVTEALPLGLRSGPAEPFFQRDIYYDSADWTLRRRGVSCRFRTRVDDRRFLTLRTIGRWEGGVPLVLPQTFEAEVPELEGAQALAGTSDPARRLRALIEPGLLMPRIQLETERRLRHTRAGWFSRGRYEVVYDVVTVRSHQRAQMFQELKLRELARGRPGLDRLARAFQGQYGLRPVLEVWLAPRVSGARAAGVAGRLQWLPFSDLLAAAGSPILRDPRTLAALTVAARSDILAEWTRPSEPEKAAAPRQTAERRVRMSDLALRSPIPDVDHPTPEHFLNSDLSLLEFNARVLELAEDASVPLLARIRFLSVLSGNLDEFFMVRVDALKRAAAIE